jgi:hypothetical protein
MSEETNTNESFTEEDLELSETLHEQLNDILLAIKQEAFVREDIEALEDGVYEKEEALEAYQRIGAFLMLFAGNLNEAILGSVFDGISPDDGDSVIIEEECCSEECECKEAE